MLSFKVRPEVNLPFPWACPETVWDDVLRIFTMEYGKELVIGSAGQRSLTSWRVVEGVDRRRLNAV